MRQRLSRQDRKERTRADLVAAAREVFMRRGFHGASLEEISDHAGYTKGAVYSNFAGKDELFLAVFYVLRPCGGADAPTRRPPPVPRPWRVGCVRW